MPSLTVSLSALLVASQASALSWRQPKGHAPYGTSFGLPGQNATFDYVVVGGGLAGLVTASRLAEDKSLSIAVVEAGTFYEISNGNSSQVPAYSFDSVAGDGEYVNPWIDWELEDSPQPQLGGRAIHYAQGKTLGGSSARNQMIYQRGSRGSYDLWAKEVGDESYAWDNILPHFARSVDFTPPNNVLWHNTSSSYTIDAYNATGGPLHVSYPKYDMPFNSYGLPAMHAAGLPNITDFSGGNLHGAAHNPFTIDPADSTRSSSETSFLQHAIQRGLPLTVYPMTQAMKVQFSSNKTATGVLVRSAGRDYTLNAKREVIVSAGAMHSPQLLMVSGIGPRETLEAHNITVISERPGVGQNMHDSCNVGSVSFPVSVISTSILDRDEEYAQNALQEYVTNGTGILSNEGGGVISFEKIPQPYRSNMTNETLSRLAAWPADWPEIELTLSSTGKSFEGSSGQSQDIVSVAVLLVAALSRGNVTINSSSMLDKPVISTNWLSDPADQEVAVQSYKRAREIWSHIPIRTGPESSPGANVTTDAQLLAHIREAVAPIHHASSTNMMGMKNETMAVVDSHARVMGVQGLRVIDSSSFRFTPPGHTQAATYAHAEKLVDLIKQELAAGGS